jgi:nucleoside-diphosphate-sugar epimerase
MFLVTGCAGFIGSHLAERLLKEGKKVKGIDSFSDYYPRPMKEGNMRPLRKDYNFKFVEGDLNAVNLDSLLEGVDVIFHQAAQPGVRSSWGKNFGVYVKSNILATQRLLEACRRTDVKKFVYASSSSVYGDAATLPTREDAVPQPVSPYGVSKLAGEHMCRLYQKDFGVPAVILRYFTVYGPRQRPDMAFYKFIMAALRNEKITVYGDGSQTRDFTYVSDAVEASLLAAHRGTKGDIFNVGGGSRVSLKDAIGIIMELTGSRSVVENKASEKGDVKHTSADITHAIEKLGYRPSVAIRSGLENEIEWIRSMK